MPLRSQQLVEASLVETGGHGGDDELINILRPAVYEVVVRGHKTILPVYTLTVDFNMKT